MTQGEILSAFAPIDTMIAICQENCTQSWIGINDVNMIIPFVNKAQKATEKLSRYVLEHFNSRDEQKRELSKLICGRFEFMLNEMNGIKFNGYEHDTTVDWLNNNIKSVTYMLFNTIEACEHLVDVLPPSTPQNKKDEKAKKKMTEEKETLSLGEESVNPQNVTPPTPNDPYKVDEQRLRNHFKPSFQNTKTGDNIPDLINLIKTTKTDIGIGQIALQIYESKFFLKDNFKTFNSWYREFCTCIGTNANSNYGKCKFKIPEEEKKSTYYFLHKP